MPTRLRSLPPPLFYGAISFAHLALKIRFMFVCLSTYVSNIITPINDRNGPENKILLPRTKITFSSFGKRSNVYYLTIGVFPYHCLLVHRYV